MSKNAVARVTNNGTFSITPAMKVGVTDFLSCGAFPATEVCVAAPLFVNPTKIRILK